MTKIIALVGKAGAGKDRIVKELVKKYPDKYHALVSFTTRPMRENEQDGVDYHFIDFNKFCYLQVANEVLEWSNFNGWFYGTPKYELSREKINVGVFNLDGLRQLVLNDSLQVSSYYVQASDKTRLLRQLNREQNPNIPEIIRRFSTDDLDFKSNSYFTPWLQLTNETEEDLIYAVDYLDRYN